MAKIYQVRSLYKDELICEGGWTFCEDYIFGWLLPEDNLYRTWTEDDKVFYDVGKVFYITEKNLD